MNKLNIKNRLKKYVAELKSNSATELNLAKNYALAALVEECNKNKEEALYCYTKHTTYNNIVDRLVEVINDETQTR